MAIKLSLDIGNSAVKGAIMADDNTLISPVLFPSAIKTISDEKYLNYPNSDSFYLKIINSSLPHLNDIVAVGNRAMQMPNYNEYDVATSSYKTGDPITASMLFASLASQITHDGKYNVKLALSVPVVEGQQIGLTDQYKQRLLGTHVVKYYRQDENITAKIKVEKVTILNEGQAAFLGLLDTVDKPFEQAMNTVYTSLGLTEDPAPILQDFIVVDIGEGTTDISVFTGKHFNPDLSFSINNGIGNVLEGAISNAAREHLTIESRKKLQEVLESTSPLQAKRQEKWEKYVDPVRASFIEDVTETIIKAYGMNDYFEAIIFAGGGFSALTGYNVDSGQIEMRNSRLFERTKAKLKDLNKDASLIFGVPTPYSQTINQRGLMQVAATL